MLKQIALISLMGMSTVAFAEAGFQVKVGGSLISPTQDTSTALGVVKADNELAFTPSVEYFLNDNFSAELLLATPIGHDVLLDGGKAAKIKHLPPTVTFKYNLKNSSPFTPYIGVGGTAFVAWDESGAAKDVKEDFGFAGQIGVNFKPADAKNWGVYFDARYAQLSPEVTLIDELGGGKFDLDIDPIVYTLGYSYKF
ncbi:OmpW/AlkL family protein [Acinetobacter sp. CFCC 10889]|uniref:OmpW/AlkL family protein n=1 Tax=Acinetobacter sp. CFCC 10889 TaxID=1775557 RepID=UPI000DCF69E4|nr:OmpW family outer membrane protein [Acinetobacter sp. CFCC 10889]